MSIIAKADRLVKKERAAVAKCCGLHKTCIRDCDFSKNCVALHPRNPYWDKFARQKHSGRKP